MKTERLIAIIMVLLEQRTMNTEKLAEMFEVSQRTIYRDMEAINRAGVPIVSCPGPGGGVGIMEAYKLEKHLFTTADIKTLLMVLGSVRAPLADEDVVNTLAKIKGLLPKEHLQAAESQAGQIQIDITPWNTRSIDQQNLALMKTALHSQTIISFSYSDRFSRISTRQVEPYRLVLKEMYWYMEGFCLDRQAFRLFKLVRMRDVQLTEQKFSLRPYNPEDLNRKQWSGEQLIHLRLKLQPELKDEYAENFGSETMREQPDGTWLAEMDVMPGPAGLRFLLGLGPGCECLEPSFVRQELLQSLEKMAENYAAAGGNEV